MELQSRHEGRSRCVDIVRNEDGTYSFTLIAEAGGGCVELKFTAIPFFTFDLGIFEKVTTRTLGGDAVTKEVPFELRIDGGIRPDPNNIYLTQRMIQSPYGPGKDQCGREIQQ